MDSQPSHRGVGVWGHPTAPMNYRTWSSFRGPRSETQLVGTSAQTALCTAWRNSFQPAPGANPTDYRKDLGSPLTITSTPHDLLTRLQASQRLMLWERPSGYSWLHVRDVPSKRPSQSSDFLPWGRLKVQIGVPQEQTFAHATKHLSKLPSARSI